MVGILIGATCVLAFLAVVRGILWRRLSAHGPHGPHAVGCASPGYGRWRGFGPRGPRQMLRWAFYRLDTSPSQEKVILEALASLRERGENLWREWQRSRAELAEALRGEALDEGKIRGAFARHDGLLTELQSAGLEALGKVHAALDAEQRKALSSLLEHPWRRSYACAGA